MWVRFPPRALDMRILEAAEVSQLQPIIRLTQEATHRSPCQKSQRAVAVFKDLKLFGLAVNEPYYLTRCLGADCFQICRQICEHAEQASLRMALRFHQPEELAGVSLLHEKRKNGLIVPTDELSCLGCSGFTIKLQQGLREYGAQLEEFILHQSTGYVAYSIEEWHQLTQEHLAGREF